MIVSYKINIFLLKIIDVIIRLKTVYLYKTLVIFSSEYCFYLIISYSIMFLKYLKMLYLLRCICKIVFRNLLKYKSIIN